MKFVTLQQASQHLRRDTDEDDADLELKIMAASGAVFNYIEQAGDDWGDSNGDPILDSNGVALDVPYVIQAATLMMTAYLYRERDASMEYSTNSQFHGLSGFYLPVGVIALLYPYRTPTAL